MKKILFALLAVAQLGCVDVAEERAHRDETVGQAKVGEATFVIVDGLGAVRKIEQGTLSIWAKAPLIQVVATRGENAPAEWDLTVTNALADADIRARIPDNSSFDAVAFPGGLPTEKRWRVTLPLGTTTMLIGPRVEPVGPWRFALLSDVQEAIDHVQDIYTRINADPDVTFVVSAGDLTTQGTDEQLDRFQHELESLRVPFFPTLGNHELGTERGAPFQRHFGRASFRFVYGGMQFTFLDSGSATIDPLVYGWLDGWLAEGRQRTHAVLMHIPPIDPFGVRNGSFANRNEASKLLAMLAAADVDLTLYGHIHSFYAFANAGIPAYISGGGGAIPERFDGIGRHYLTVDVDPERGILQTAIVRVDPD